MGSDYYEVAVEDVREARGVLRVTSLDSNASPPFETSSFAMNLLVDLWASLVNGWPVGGLEPGDAAKALACSVPWVGLEALSHGERIEVTAADIRALQQALDRNQLLRYRGGDVAGWTSDEAGRQFVVRPPDPAGFADAVEPLVTSCIHDEHEHQETYEIFQSYVDPENPVDVSASLPRVRITLQVTDATLLAFVRRGMVFRSRAYF